MLKDKNGKKLSLSLDLDSLVYLSNVQQQQQRRCLSIVFYMQTLQQKQKNVNNEYEHMCKVV